MRPHTRITITAALLAGLAAPGPATSYAQSPAPPGTVQLSDHQVLSVALSQGQVYFTRYDASLVPVILRTVHRNAGVVELGWEQPVSVITGDNAIAASSGRAYFDTRTRTYTGTIKPMGGRASMGRKASGNRALVTDSSGPFLDHLFYDDLYDAKRAQPVNAGSYEIDVPQPPPAWPQGPQDLDGNYFLRARPDGSVVRRDWQVGREIVVRPAGSRIQAVAIHGAWVAWVTGCEPYTTCPQTLTIRNLSTGAVRIVGTSRTVSLDISGGHLAYDAESADGPELRVVQLSTGSVTTIGQLAGPVWGMSQDYPQTTPRHFDVEDELIAWIDRDGYGRLTPLPASIDAPHYLGNGIAPASFSTRWAIAVPVSKALPVCTVTIYRGTTKVRVLDCANTIGMVSVVWDGRTGRGAILPAGKYTYRVSGRDDDGYWLRHYDGTLTPVIGTVTKTT